MSKVEILVENLIERLKEMSSNSLSNGDFDTYMDVVSDLSLLQDTYCKLHNSGVVICDLDIQEVLNKYSYLAEA